MSLAVVGADYPNARGPTRRFEIVLCVPGETIELRREPKNPADSRAIDVYSLRGVQLGYIVVSGHVHLFDPARQIGVNGIQICLKDLYRDCPYIAVAHQSR